MIIAVATDSKTMAAARTSFEPQRRVPTAGRCSARAGARSHVGRNPLFLVRTRTSRIEWFTSTLSFCERFICTCWKRRRFASRRAVLARTIISRRTTARVGPTPEAHRYNTARSPVTGVGTPPFDSPASRTTTDRRVGSVLASRDSISVVRERLCFYFPPPSPFFSFSFSLPAQRDPTVFWRFIVRRRSRALAHPSIIMYSPSTPFSEYLEGEQAKYPELKLEDIEKLKESLADDQTLPPISGQSVVARHPRIPVIDAAAGAVRFS